MKSLVNNIGKEPAILADLVTTACSILTTDNDDIVHWLFDLELLDIFNGLMVSTCMLHVRRDILWGLSNLACHSSEVIKTLVEHPIYKQVVNTLVSTDIGLRKEAIFIISNILLDWKPANLVYNLIENDQQMLKNYLRGLKLDSESVLMTIMRVIEKFCDYDSELNLHG